MLEEVSLPRGQLVKQVSVGRRHVVVLTTSGEVFSMGLNCFGQCGFPLSPSPSSPGNLLPLQPLHTPSPVVKVCCGLDHTHFLTSEGLLYSCGWSDDGQTGTGCRGSLATPTRVAGDVMTERVRDVQCCADTSLAITESSGGIYGWGNNEYRQLHIESSDMQVFEPWKVNLLPNQSDAGEVVAMTIGSSFSATLTERGDIYVAGRLGGREKGGEGWGLLHDSGSRSNEEVVDVKAGLHYLAALVREGKGHQRLLLWGRHSTKTPPLADPHEMELPSSHPELGRRSS
ncbi:RCC1-like G exchanging factor-like protein [Geodia barretti]|nr:RCC1-like G exchanging factor-like protein [Geodia barretti]